MKLIVGLGNPDKKYFKTYHNTGFNAVDFFVKQQGLSFSTKKCKAEICKGDGFIVAKPQTYMNLSGEAVLELSKKYKIKPEEILIVLDDIDLDLGTYRYRENGSGGTHNGLRNIVQLLKTTNCKRIRIGIGRDERMDLADYVLSKISKNNQEKINETIERAIDFLETII